MGDRDRMLAAIVESGRPLCDDCVAPRAQLSSRQRANQVGRILLDAGLIQRRAGHCELCGGAKTVNLSADAPFPATAGAQDLYTSSRPWHWEGNVQQALVGFLDDQGWSILSTANTATKESGVDVVAVDSHNNEWWISVKGYPEARGGKTTNPSTQARHWFSHALFDVALYRTASESVSIGVAIPGPFVTYERLAERSKWMQYSAPYTLFVIAADGSVDVRTPR